MATLAFAALGSAVGGAVGGSFLGVSAAAIGQAVGATVGRAVDQRLLSGLSPTRTDGPRLETLDIMTSREGAALPSIAGRAAVSGEVIWAAKLKETTQVDRRRVGSGKAKQTVETTNYEYAASFALSLGEGPLRHFGRLWANGQPLDLTGMIEEGRVRFYPGDDSQLPDPMIDGIEGGAPAYRGTAYLVFEDLPLKDWGNSVPQIKVEVWGQSGEMEELVRGVNIIPGSTEWGYMPTPVDEVRGADSRLPVNATRHGSVSDWSLALDQLGALMPNVDTGSLVVAWFGTDLRAGLCEIEPRSELRDKVTEPPWIAGGLTRAQAKETSRSPQGAPAYGSSPADISVIRAIQDLRARGQRVVLYPFIMMDITGDSGLVDPDYPDPGAVGYGVEEDGNGGLELAWYSGVNARTSTSNDGFWDGEIIGGRKNDRRSITLPQSKWVYIHSKIASTEPVANGEIGDWGLSLKIAPGTSLEDLGLTVTPPTQGAYPWRGRIRPTAGADVEAEVAAFMGTAAASDFTVDTEAETARYTGPNEWRFRRFILHLAHLAKAAGGVDAFLIGTEMRGLSMAPAGDGSYPFVTALKALAAEVRMVLPDAQISYAADWSEYHSHQVGGDLRFHLDPLWSDPNIDFVGIDNYLPLSDWRAGKDHADYDDAKGHTTPYDLGYLKGNIEGGEYWDWYYASAADRAAQIRTPIQDLAHGEPWVYRQKAIRDWHAKAHHDRLGGVRQPAATDWVPGSKPIWFTELGCPAVDLGPNQPNVFYAENSSEGALPHFSVGVRDDYIQRQFLRASHEWWRDNGGAAVDVANIQVWAWDARPWPEYPRHRAIWADGPDWVLGHWLNGRAGAAPAAEALARRLTAAHGLTPGDLDLSACHGQADGYPAAAPIGFRDFMQPLEVGLGLQAHEQDGKLVVESRAAARTLPEVGPDTMVDVPRGAPFLAKRGALEDVPGAAVMRFSDGLGAYEQVSTRAVIGAGPEAGVSTVDSPLVLDFDRGSAASERLLRAATDGRDTVTFRLPRSAVEVRPGVILPVRLTEGGPARPMIVDRVVDGEDRQLEARSFNPGAFAPTGGVFRPAPAIAVRGSSLVTARVLDLPILPGSTAEPWDSLVAVSANPWPGAVLAKSTDGTTFGEGQSLPFRSISGVTTTDLTPAPHGLWDRGHVEVELVSGALVTRSDGEVLAGANGLAVEHPGGWEVLQYAEAELIGSRRFRLSRMLRGQQGTDSLLDAPLPAGATVVVLDTSLTPLGLEEGEIGLSRFYRTGSARADVTTHVIREHIGNAVGLRPYAPCHLRATWEGGDLSVTWVRRSRVDTEADWNAGATDPPLGEAEEAYVLEVLAAGETRRRVTLSEPAFAYGASAQAADGVAAPFTLRVAQVSARIGPGAWASLEIT